MINKVKLAAIAKDEAAYLPEWIYHHLSIGFDEIEILVNYTSDNSIDILDKISNKHPVKYRIIDESIVDAGGDFQSSAYNLILKETLHNNNVSHLMFLDIDEFWTDSKFEHSIKDCIRSLSYPDAIAFPWEIKLDDSFSEFDGVYSHNITLVPGSFVKTIFCTSAEINHVYAHKVDTPSKNYKLSDGKEFTKKNKACLDDNEFSKDTFRRYFILHRIYRSQVEYVSMLGKGRPRKGENGISIKDNRNGYMNSSSSSIQLEVNSLFVENYAIGYEKFLIDCDLVEDLERAKRFVLDRYYGVVNHISSLDRLHQEVIDKIFRGVNIPLVEKVLSNLNYKWKEETKILSLVNNIRDLAIELESIDLNKALQCMNLAKKMRPNGPVINSKIQEYKSKLVK